MVELLILLKDIFMPFVLSYSFITITGFAITLDVLKTFKEKIDLEGYKIKDSDESFKEKVQIISFILRQTLNPITSLRLMVGIFENKDILNAIKESLINDGTIVPKKNIDNIKEETYKEKSKNENHIKAISNKEKLAYLENEKKFLLDEKKNNEDIIDEYVYTKKY